MQKTFNTPGPTSLYVEIGTGDVALSTAAVTETTVTVDGKHADDVLVENEGDQIVVIAPRGRGSFGGSADLSVRVTLPHDSAFACKVGSADVEAGGRLGDVKVKTGSGEVALEEIAGDALVETGSGDVRIEQVLGDLRVKSGSADVEVGRIDGEATVSTGSGDVQVGSTTGAIEVKSGSGDLNVRDAGDDVALSTASGDLVVGRMVRGALVAKNASGDIRVGIPAGIPVWTDVSSVTGSVRSTLSGAGQPAEGQDYIEIRAKTVSGDIALEEL
ncbi:MAG: DUF4097 family beta strand repeat-containing protein [Nocardioidaceae bacterium]